MAQFKGKKHRLEDRFYEGAVTVSFTLCVQERKRVFEQEAAVSQFRIELERCALAQHSLVPIYCFMPDHLHVMVRGIGEDSRPKKVIELFKLATGRWLARHQPEYRWQSGYFDHMILHSKDWKRHALYILNNPVRAGLVVDPYAYPHTGTIGYNLKQMLFES